MNKMREYEHGREDGLLLAQKIVRDGGAEALDRITSRPLRSRPESNWRSGGTTDTLESP